MKVFEVKDVLCYTVKRRHDMITNNNNEKWIGIEEAAEYMGVTKDSI